MQLAEQDMDCIVDCNPASRCCATAYLTGKGGFWRTIFEEIQMKDCKYSNKANGHCYSFAWI